MLHPDSFLLYKLNNQHLNIEGDLRLLLEYISNLHCSTSLHHIRTFEPQERMAVALRTYRNLFRVTGLAFKGTAS